MEHRRPHKCLVLWQKAMDFVGEIYENDQTVSKKRGIWTEISITPCRCVHSNNNFDYEQE